MHSHRRVLPVVHSQVKRHAATAAKLKPAPEAEAQWNAPLSNAGKGAPGKWALKSQSEPQGVQAKRHIPSLQLPRSSSSSTPQATGKWALPNKPSITSAPRFTPSQGQTSNTRSPRGNNPSFTLPPAPNHNKWALNPSQTQKPHEAVPSSSKAFQIPRLDLRTQSNLLQHDRARRDDPSSSRVQRDQAPHIGLKEVSSSVEQTRDADEVSQQITEETVESKSATRGKGKKGEQQSGPVVVLTDGYDTREERHNRVDKKSRGSLLHRRKEDDVAIPSHHREHTIQQQAKPEKRRSYHEKQVSVDVYIPSIVSVGTLARLLDVKLGTLQRKMRQSGMGEETSYDHMLTSDYAALLVEEFGKNPVINDEAAFDIYPSAPHPDPTSLPSRPPIITIMGHVDHGKTTLLDNLRSTSVAKGEVGGITQHIGAFSVPVTSTSSSGPRSITFLDTPGHAAFSAMRARGAGVTDIVVLVVAADDGVMPQTKEVINLVKQDDSKVGLVVAINKVDKPGVDVTKVQHALMAEGVQLEALGGDVPSVEVSGLTGHGLTDLVETLSVMSEMQNLTAEQEGPVHGYILESKVMKGLGPVATVLVLRGSLKPGAHLIAGVSHAKVRLMTESSGSPTKNAVPGTAVIVSGWKTLPSAGDEVLQAGESDIKKALANRERKAELEGTLADVEAINASRRKERETKEHEDAKKPEIAADEKENQVKELRLIVKGDVSGSVEAVVGALQGIGNHIATTKIISSGVGDISESDVMMAKAAKGMIVGFSVKAPRSIESLAAQNGVSIYSSDIIYRLMEEIKSRVIALLPTVVEKRVSGEATVLQLFDITVKGKTTKKVAGCRVTNGLVEKSKKARIMRDGVLVHEGSLDTMRVLKKDVTEIRKGTECGLNLADFDDIKEGDVIQMYQEFETPGSF